MLYGLNDHNADKEFHQRVADQNIQNIDDRQEEIQHAKNGFIGMLAGIIVGGVVGWLFLGPTNNTNKEKEIPVIRRPILSAKVQPNDPGGMEIDNQNREIYHIVDNIHQENGEINIIPAPEMPKLITENSIQAPENMENLVESIEEDSNLNNVATEVKNMPIENVKIAGTELSAIKTNSNEKIIIPEKLKDIDIKLQKTINSEKNASPARVVENKVPEIENKAPEPKAMTRGTWYAQIIASSSRNAVNSLWNQLSAKHAFLRNYRHEVEEITTANGNTLYRLKVGGFNTRAEAEKLSNELKQHQISSIIKQN